MLLIFEYRDNRKIRGGVIPTTANRLQTLEQKIYRIQQSSKTLLPIFIKPHDLLRMHSRWYYLWHLFPYAQTVHIILLLAFLVVSPFVVHHYLTRSVEISAEGPIVVPRTYDLASASVYNLRFTSAAGDDIGNRDINTADLDNDGKPDIIVGAAPADNNGRVESGSVYIIFNTLLTTYSGTGNAIDLADPTKYNLRFDGALADDFLGDGGGKIGDLDNDGKLDLIIGAAGASNNARAFSGSLYVMYNTLIDNYSGTGNNIDLATATNYNLRYDGAAAGDLVGNRAFAAADVNTNSKQDIIVDASEASNNARPFSGSLYVIYDSLIDDYAGTGNTIDLATAANYNLRYDGAATDELLAEEAMHIADIDNDGKRDILVGTAETANGSLYVIYNTLIDDYAGTGNAVDLASTSNFNLRYDGAAVGDNLTSSGALTTGDVDNDNKLDILVGAWVTGNNGRADSGSLYVFYNSLIDDYTGTGNTINLVNTSNFNLRYDGAVAGDNLAGRGVAVFDFDNDTRQDIMVGAPSADNNSRINSGSLYVIYNNLIDDYSGTGNSIDLANTTKYNLRYDGVTANDGWENRLLTPGDLDNNGKLDILNSPGTGNGSLYAIYNFPHTLSLTPVSATTSASVTYNGTITAANSTTTINAVQYSVDTSGFTGTWNSCTANDSSFDSTSEPFSCGVTLSSPGTYTIRLRAQDVNGSYTAVSQYTATSTNYSVPVAASTSTPAPAAADTTPPGVTLTSIGNGTFRPSTKIFTYISQQPRPSFSGAAESGAQVTVSDGATTLCTATGTSSGTWSCKTASVLEFKEYEITVSAVDSAGNTTTLPPFKLIVTPPDEAVAIDTGSDIPEASPGQVTGEATSPPQPLAVSQPKQDGISRLVLILLLIIYLLIGAYMVYKYRHPRFNLGQSVRHFIQQFNVWPKINKHNRL